MNWDAVDAMTIVKVPELSKKTLRNESEVRNKGVK